MFNDSFADLKGEIQSRVSGKTLFELLNNPERMKIVVKTVTVRAHQGIQSPFACVPKRRVANVMNQRERFCKINVQAQGLSYGPGNLRNFEGVGQPIAEMVGVARGENLCFRFQ